MNLVKRIRVRNLENDRTVVERLVDENISGKLDAYLQKFKGDDAEGTINVTIESDKKGLFRGSLQATLHTFSFHFEREDYKKLDDLVNHLFEHLKEELSEKVSKMA